VEACIHRGGDEIGGSCVELRANSGDRLLLDLGLPLDSEEGEGAPPASIVGLDGSDPRLLGIVISHSHPDHYGLVDAAAPEIPVFMGAATERILKEALYFTPMGLERTTVRHLVDREPMTVGHFMITPFTVDHSAFGAYALVVEADGRRLFYSGDLRAHGRKPGAFRSLLEHPPPAVDVLVLEGTTISRHDVGVPFTENDVEARLRGEIRATPGLFLACYSAQNVDRLVSVYRATIQEGRDLIVDLYGASIAAATSRDSIPQSSWERVRVYVPQGQRVKVKLTKEFWRVNEIGRSRIYTEEIAEDPGHWAMSFRSSMAVELERAGLLADARVAWMMWPGYLEGERGARTREAFDSRGIPLSIVHASGHASVEDLQLLARAVSPRRVVPIHTAASERYPDLFDNVVAHADGEWWDV
jgi:ribonuclease J